MRLDWAQITLAVPKARVDPKFPSCKARLDPKHISCKARLGPKHTRHLARFYSKRTEPLKIALCSAFLGK